MTTRKSRVTVVITTHNRCEEVTQAVESCLRQTEPCEVLVYDDASTDQTTDTLQARFPGIRVIHSDKRTGYITLRNRGFREATGEFIVSIDDDAYFTSPETLGEVVEMFDEFPNAAALALSYIEPYSGRETMPDLPHGTRMRNYIGCSHAVRREIALEMGSYPELLIHQGEERDLTIRLIDRGFDILFADTPPIVHLYSPKRDMSRISYYGFRNTIWFCWMRLPFPECLFRAIMQTLSLFGYQFSWGSLGERLRSLGAGWLGLIPSWRLRVPVSRNAYRQYRQFATHGPRESKSAPCPVLRTSLQPASEIESSDV